MEEKRKVGRPTKYKPEYCQAIVDFFDVSETVSYTYEQATASGKIVTVNGERARKMPTVLRFAMSIDVTVECLYEWKRQIPEFSVAFNKAKQMRQEFFNNNALSGNYNASYAKFYAINCTDMKSESQIVAEANAKNDDKPIQVTFTDSRVKDL